MQVISSKDNEFVKHVKKLKEKKYRDQSQEFIIEGIKLVKEAIEEKANNKVIGYINDARKKKKKILILRKKKR